MLRVPLAVKFVAAWSVPLLMVTVSPLFTTVPADEPLVVVSTPPPVLSVSTLLPAPPAKLPTVCFWPFKSNVPPDRVTVELFASTLPLPPASRSVPPLTVVAPV